MLVASLALALGIYFTKRVQLSRKRAKTLMIFIGHKD